MEEGDERRVRVGGDPPDDDGAMGRRGSGCPRRGAPELAAAANGPLSLATRLGVGRTDPRGEQRHRPGLRSAYPRRSDGLTPFACPRARRDDAQQGKRSRVICPWGANAGGGGDGAGHEGGARVRRRSAVRYDEGTGSEQEGESDPEVVVVIHQKTIFFSFTGAGVVVSE